MSSRLTEVIVDCRQPGLLAKFWCAVLDYRVIEASSDLVEIAAWDPSAEAILDGPVPPTLVFVRVPEPKTVKNRLHMDLSPTDRGRDEEVERLLALGARRVDIGQGERSWVVLADPEDNEFCVLRSLRPS